MILRWKCCNKVTTGQFASEGLDCLCQNHFVRWFLVIFFQQETDAIRRSSSNNEVWLQTCIDMEPTTFLVYNKPFLALSIDLAKNADVTPCINWAFLKRTAIHWFWTVLIVVSQFVTKWIFGWWSFVVVRMQAIGLLDELDKSSYSQ